MSSEGEENLQEELEEVDKKVKQKPETDREKERREKFIKLYGDEHSQTSSGPSQTTTGAEGGEEEGN